MARFREEKSADTFEIENVIKVNRTSKTVKGGRRNSFSALVVVGDGKGHVGLGFGKANETTDAISKAYNDGRKNIVEIKLYNTTIPFAATGKFKAGKVFLKPATTGTGVIAGGAVRAVLEAVGVKDILSKSMGSNNPINMAKATLTALQMMTRMDDVLARRGLRGKNKENEAPETPAAE